jgi:hypothetical protein
LVPAVFGPAGGGADDVVLGGGVVGVDDAVEEGVFEGRGELASPPPVQAAAVRAAVSAVKRRRPARIGTPFHR